MEQTQYQKTGYLHNDFKIFHLLDDHIRDFSYHYHAFNKILIPLQGQIIYHIEGRSYHLEPYDIVLINAGEIHKPSVAPSAPYERIIIYVSNDFINSYANDEYDLNACFEQARQKHSHVLRVHAAQSSKLYRTMTELEQSLSDTAYASSLYSQILFLEFLILLNRASLTDRIDFLKTDISNSKILDIMEYITSHLAEELSIDVLAERFFLDKYYLMHLFKKEAGCTIGSYITGKRLQKADELILTGMPVTTAAYECGFRNYSTFSRAYKKYFQCSPKEKNTRNLSTAYKI